MSLFPIIEKAVPKFFDRVLNDISKLDLRCIGRVSRYQENELLRPSFRLHELPGELHKLFARQQQCWNAVRCDGRGVVDTPRCARPSVSYSNDGYVAVGNKPTELFRRDGLVDMNVKETHR
jgi:hypothetical protein